MPSYKIYKLTDTRYPEDHSLHVRYIGATYGELNGRLREHLKSWNKSDSPKHSWLKGARSEKVKIKIIPLEVVNSVIEARKREIYWIAYHKQHGYSLVNQRFGGYSIDTLNLPMPKGVEEQEASYKDMLEPTLALCDKTGLEKLLGERETMRNSYEAVNGATSLTLEMMLEENAKNIQDMLSEYIPSDALAVRAREALKKPLPKQPTGSYLTPWIERYRQIGSKKLTGTEQDILEKIECGEIEGKTAEVLREAIGIKEVSATSDNVELNNDDDRYAHLNDMPALKTFLENVEKYGDDHYIFYLGKEPTASKREKVESLKEEARKKGWKEHPYSGHSEE